MKINKEQFKTYGDVFDQSTLQALFKLMSQGYFEKLKSTLFVGKEANIFSAETKDTTLVIVKIYRTSVRDFNKMASYLKTDPRYNGARGERKIVFAWTQREYRNLVLAKEANVRVPLPIAFNKNILIMELIGENIPAKKIKRPTTKKSKRIQQKTYK